MGALIHMLARLGATVCLTGKIRPAAGGGLLQSSHAHVRSHVSAREGAVREVSDSFSDRIIATAAWRFSTPRRA